tara:strand:+ start:768 stop:2210 length:1443 start_codon:yes stop_codon:yes gene_type:complete
MKFNFGAMLGGAAKQIVEDVTERENEVKLRTRTILDRHVAETAANRKEYKAKKEKVEQQIKQVAAYFGDDPYALNKARDIVAGGDSHVTNMLSKFELHTKNKGDVNELYKYTPNKDEVGFKGVEDATDSIVKLATVATPDFGASEQTSGLLGLFGKTDQMKSYKEARSQYEASGLIDAPKVMTEPGATYGTGSIDLSKLAQDAKSLDQMESNAFDIQQNSKEGSPEHTKATKTLEAIKTRKLDTSAAYNIAKIKAEADAKGDIPSLSGYTTIHTKGLDRITQRFKSPIIKGPDGKPIEDPTDKDAYEQQVKREYNKNFIKGLIRNGYDKNAQDLIQSTPELAELQEEVEKEITGQDKIEDTAPKVKKTEKEIFEDIKKQFPNAPDFVAQGVNEGRNLNKLFKRVQQIYGVDSKIAQQLIGQAQKNKPKKKDYGTFIDLTKPAPERPSGGIIYDSDEEKKAMDDWDKTYGETHNEDGSLKK